MTLLSSFFCLVIEIEIAILVFCCILYVVLSLFQQYNKAKSINERMEKKNTQGQRADKRTDEGRRGKNNGSRERSEYLRKQIDYDVADTLGSCGLPPDPMYHQMELSSYGLDEELQLPPLKTSDELDPPEYTDSGEVSQKGAGVRLGIRDGEAGDTYRQQQVIVEKEDGELKIVGSKGKIYYVVPARTILVESDCIDSALHTCFYLCPEPVFDGDCQKYKVSVEAPARLMKQGNSYSLLSTGGMGRILLERIG